MTYAVPQCSLLMLQELKTNLEASLLSITQQKMDLALKSANISEKNQQSFMASVDTDSELSPDAIPDLQYDPEMLRVQAKEKELDVQKQRMETQLSQVKQMLENAKTLVKQGIKDSTIQYNK